MTYHVEVGFDERGFQVVSILLVAQPADAVLVIFPHVVQFLQRGLLTLQHFVVVSLRLERSVELVYRL